MRQAGTGASGSPAMRIPPPAGLISPVSSLRSVDLPAPFGPIRIVVVPPASSSVASATSRRPPATKLSS